MRSAVGLLARALGDDQHDPSVADGCHRRDLTRRLGSRRSPARAPRGPHRARRLRRRSRSRPERCGVRWQRPAPRRLRHLACPRGRGTLPASPAGPRRSPTPGRARVAPSLPVAARSSVRQPSQAGAAACRRAPRSPATAGRRSPGRSETPARAGVSSSNWTVAPGRCADLGQDLAVRAAPWS